MREEAKSALECFSLKSLEKIRLGRDLSIPSWVIDGFVELVQATTITDEEALKLDLDAPTTAYRLFRIREMRISGGPATASSRLMIEWTMTKVEEIFKEELDHVRSAEKTLQKPARQKIMPMGT